jgi:predicted transcriptional regulator
MKATTRKSAKAEHSDYDRWKTDQIKLGLDDIDAGRVMTHAEFMKQSDAHLKRLARKHAKVA